MHQVAQKLMGSSRTEMQRLRSFSFRLLMGSLRP
jgi:hypothetical protein